MIDHYNRWLRQDIRRLILTIVVVALLLWGLWAVEARFQMLQTLVNRIVVAPLPSG
jgi:hypothetical protein